MIRKIAVAIMVLLLLHTLCACTHQTPIEDESVDVHPTEKHPESQPPEQPDLQTTNYRNGVVGLLYDQKNGSNMVLYNTDDWSYTTLKELPEVTTDNYAAMSADGLYIAYTTWIDDYAFRYLVVENTVTSEVKTFYEDLTIRNEIIKISFIPDSHTLIFVKRDANTQSYEEIRTLDVETGAEKTLVKGEVWQCKSVEDVGVTAEPFYLKGSGTYLEAKEKEPASESSTEIWNYYLMQDDLNDLCKEYGGKTEFSIDEVNFIYVEFSAPRASADGTKILYSATLCRNSAPHGSPLWMAAAVWMIDAATGETSMIYTQGDEAGIGRVDWTGTDDFCFVSYYDNNGGRDSINHYNLSGNKHTVIFPYTDEHFNNVTLLPVGNNKVTFTSSGKEQFFEESETILFDITNNNYATLSIPYEGENVLLTNFIYVSYIRK